MRPAPRGGMVTVAAPGNRIQEDTMALIQWDPLREMSLVRDELSRMLSRVEGPSTAAGAPWAPTSDVIETDDGLVITAELPGVSDADIRVTVEDGVLHIRGERHLHDEVRRDRYHRIERSYGGFERSFRLPPGVREEDIHASTAYGVLRVTVPRAHDAERRPVDIPVKAG